MNSMLADSETTWPLSPEQRAVLSMSGTPPADAVHLLRIEVQGSVDPARLRAAVEHAVTLHEVLRLSIGPVAGYRGLRLRRCDAPPLRWQPPDRPDAPAALHRWRDAGLEIGQGGVVRAALVRTGDARHTLALTISALTADRGSLVALAEGIACAYRDGGADDGAELFQYPQYIEWREDLAHGNEAQSGRAYWNAYLQEAGAPSAPRLAYRQRGARAACASRWRSVRAIDAAMVHQITAVATRAATSVEVLLQATWWLLLARLTGFERCAGGWQHDCRRDYDVMQGTVGVFEKVLPITVDVTADESFTQCLARLSAVACAHVQAQEYWPIDTPPSQAHLGVGFAFHDAAVLPRGWHVAELPAMLPCFELALQVEVDWSGTAGEMTVQADASLYPRQAVDRLLEQYATLLEAVIEQPDRPVSQLPCIGQHERRALMALRGPAADFGVRTIAAHVALWALETPHAPANLAHVLPEGGLRLAGRADHQVKIRGFRVEPAEVEAALLTQPGVSQAVVLTLHGEGGTAELAAFLVGHAHLAGESGRHALRERLATLLPPHMLPSRYASLEAFPRLPNGKIDRLALQGLLQRDDQTWQRPMPSSGDAVEAAIAHCMATLLKRPALGAHDDFFDLGGHSLLAIKLAARLRKLFQVELAPAAVFEHTSAASLAGFIWQDPAAAPELMSRARHALAHACETVPVQAHAAPPVVPDPDGVHVLSRHGERMPLFCFPGLFASALEYRTLVDALPPDRPVHSFVCHTLRRARWHDWRLEDLAAGYGRYIADTVGNGPVALLGWSVGGDLAFEVARQLAGRGLELRFVGLLDVMHPAATQLHGQERSQVTDADCAVASWIARSAMRSRWQVLFACLDDEEKALATAFLHDHVICTAPDGDGTEATEYRAWARVNHAAMMRRYVWRPCLVPAYVWRAEQSVANAPQRLRDWRTLADVRREAVVPGRDHRSLLDDATLARELNAALMAVD